MLDTNMVSDFIRNPNGTVAARLKNFGAHRACISVLVAAELRYGSEQERAPRLSALVEAAIGAMTVVPLEPPVDRIYAQVRAHLTAAGTPIGPTDLFIAAHALALDLTLVTANDREFSRVPGLRVENWLD